MSTGVVAVAEADERFLLLLLTQTSEVLVLRLAAGRGAVGRVADGTGGRDAEDEGLTGVKKCFAAWKAEEGEGVCVRCDGDGAGDL